MEAKYKKYEEEVSIPEKLSAVLKADRQKELADMQKRIQEYGQNAQKELQQKELDLIKPIMEKAQAAIKKVAKAKGFQYVLDSTTGSGVLVADGTDLLADVKKELGF